MCFALGAALILPLVALETEGVRRSIVDRVMRYILTHSVKIIIVAWQILTQVGEWQQIRNDGVKACFYWRYMECLIPACPFPYLATYTTRPLPPLKQQYSASSMIGVILKTIFLTY